MHHILFLIICFIWGSNFLLMKKASLFFGPISIGAYRVLGGAIVLGIVWAARGKAWPLKRKHFAPIVFIVLLGYAWPFSIQPFLIARYGGSFIAMMVTLVPLLTILVSIPILGVRPTRRQLVGVCGGLLCIALVFREGNVQLHVSLGDLLLAATVPLTYSLANVVLKLRCAEIGTLPLTLASLALASALLLPIGWSSEGFRPNSNGPNDNGLGERTGFSTAPQAGFASRGGILLSPTRQTGVLYVVWLGVIGTGVANFLFYKLIQEHGPLFASMVTYFIPTIALFWGWVDHERITPLQIAGLAGTFCMIALVQSSRAVATVTEVEELT